MRIKYKISLIFLIQFVFFLIFIILFLSWFTFRQLRQEIISNLEDMADSRANHIETYLKSNIERLQLITSRTKLRSTIYSYNQNPNNEDRKTILDIIIDSASPIKDFERVCVVGLDGEVIASTNQSFIGRNVFGKNFFVQGMQNESVNFIKEDEIYKIFVSGPFIFEDEIIGVSLTVVSFDKLSDIVQSKIGLGKTGEVVVAFLDENGNRQYPVARRFEHEAVIFDTENIDVAFTTKEAFFKDENIFLKTYDYRNKEVVAVSKYIDIADLALIAKMDKSEIESKIFYLILIFSLISTIFIIFYYFFTILFSSFISKSIEKLHHGTEIIEKGNLDYKVGINSNDEIGQLSRSFDKMTETIKKSQAEIDFKVAEQTKEIIEKQKYLEDQQKAVLNILEDIEEEKENVKKEKDKINTILQSIGDGVFVVDNNLKITIFNPVASEISGYSIKEALGKRYDQVLNFIFEKDEKINDQFIKEAIRTGQIKDMANHTLLIRKDKTKVAVADSAAPLKDNKGKIIGCVVVFRDVTKEREIDKMKTEFVSLASHQLRTPLSAIKWFLEMVINGDAGKINKEQKEYLQQAFESNERMVKLVNDLLNVSRLEMGRLAVAPVPTDLVKLCQDLIGELTPLLKAHNLKFKFIKPAKLQSINIDQKLIGQVIANFLSNAIKYTHGGGDVELKIETNNKNIKVSVKDSGIGIPQNQQAKIFEKFFRADNVATTDTEGTGLGLYVAKKVMEVSGGQIGFNSIENKGTTFWFILPFSGSKKISGEKSLEDSFNLKK